MARAVVAVIRCADYSPDTLNRATGQLIEFIGGLEALIQPNDSVFFKINHLGNYPLELAINTHPAVVSAFALTLRHVTTNVTVGDGLESMDPTPFETTGFSQMCRKEGLNLVNFCRQGYVSVEIPNPHTQKQVPIPPIVTEADLVITVPKLKTHVLTLLTGAVKNSYGYLPHNVRVRLHREHVGPTDFSGAVVDVYAACRPGLVVMDAIDALEGSGPGRSGRARHLGLLIAGRDGVAVDAVASAIIGIDPMSVATTRIAHERGLGVGNLAEIEVIGECISDVRYDDFAKPTGYLLLTSAAERLPTTATRLVSAALGLTRERPHVSTKKCTGCRQCVLHCPQDVITIADGKARIDLDGCISCFCCMEFCPSDAIRPARSMQGQVLAAGFKTMTRAGRLLGHILSGG